MPDAEPLHMWRFHDVEFGERGSTTRYQCELCPEVLVVGPGEPHPEEC